MLLPGALMSDSDKILGPTLFEQKPAIVVTSEKVFAVVPPVHHACRAVASAKADGRSLPETRCAMVSA